MKREEWDDIPKHQGDISEEEEVFDPENDPDENLEETYLEYFRSFYHMNQERGQHKIFGHEW